VIGHGPISRIDIVRSGSISAIDISSLPSEERLEWSLERKIPRLAAGEFHYVRVVFESGGVAWSSPIYAD
jgi:hypothetical protein